jgi:hypothetical protein
MSFADQLDDPLLHELYAYWRGKCGGRRMPRRRDIDPSEMARLLPHLLISEVVGGGERFRFRLAGTAIARALGRDPTGRLVDEVVEGAYGDFINGLHRTVCREQASLFAEGPHRSGTRGEHYYAKRLLMPLSDDGVAVNQILSMLTFRFTARGRAMTVLDAPALARAAE